jgi:hypothetical protein
MKTSDLRRKLRLQRQELRAQLALMRQRARARCQPIRRDRHQVRRRLARAMAVSAALLIIWLLRCEPETTPPPPAVKIASKPPVKAPEPRVSRKPATVTGTIDHRPRSAYQTKTQAPASWIDDFRLQAAGRSPRLARCFAGSERPGAVRWMAALNPETGTVSDQDLEPLGPRSALTAEQRVCVLRALSDPRYRLSSPPLHPFPERISLVIEF